MTFLLENALPVHTLHLTRGKGGHAAQLDKVFDAITHKATTKGPVSSVIPADVSMNPMADPPKAPHKVYACNTILTLVSTNVSLHYRSATSTLVCNFSYHQVLNQVWQEMDQSLTSQQEEEINLGFRHPDPLPISMQISPAPKCPLSLIHLWLHHPKTLPRWSVLIHQVSLMTTIQI